MGGSKAQATGAGEEGFGRWRGRKQRVRKAKDGEKGRRKGSAREGRAACRVKEMGGTTRL